MSNKRKKKKSLWKQYPQMVFVLLMGAACGIIMVTYATSSADALQNGDFSALPGILLEMSGLLIGMCAAMYFHTIVHEAGHLVFGLLSGYKFNSFRIMSFIWLKENGKLRLKRLSLAGTGGQCLMSPPDLKDGTIPFALYNLGGSLMNIIVSVLLIIAYLLCPGVYLLSPLFLIFAAVGFTIALMNGIPLRMGTVNNDGHNAYTISKDPDAPRAFWIQLKVSEQNAGGVRLRDMPAEWFTVPSDEAMKNSIIATCGVFACSRLMDEEKFGEAGVLIDRLLALDSGIIGLDRGLMVCDRLYIELIGENRREIIENLLTDEQRKFMKSMKSFLPVIRTEYALALLFEKNTEKAEKTAGQFAQAARTYPYPQEAESEKKLSEIAKSASE